MDDRRLRLTEAWFRILAEAARGTRAAQATIRDFAGGQLGPEKVARQIARWLPGGVQPPATEKVTQWMDELWSAIGVVPRSRYQELLERYEALRARLEEAEVTIRRLKRLLSEKGHEGDAQKLLDLWSTAVGETLRSQADWMRTWIDRSGEPDAQPGTAPPQPPQRQKSRKKP